MALNVTSPTPHRRLDSATAGDRLGCGRELDDVWDRIGAPPDAHEQRCPYCREARQSLGGLAEATSRLRAADAEDPTLVPSPGALQAILTIARAEVRRGRRIPLQQGDAAAGGRSGSSLMISEQTIAGLIRHTGDRMAGLEVRRCSVRIAPSVGDPDPAAPSTVRVLVTASAARELSIPAVIELFRREVITAVRDQIGIAVVAVDVVVEDVYDAG